MATTLVSKSAVGNLGDPYSDLPKVYTRGNFEETALSQKYGTQPSRREQRQFKRYLNSDAGVAAENSWLKSENEKELASYNEYAKALSAKSQARVQAVKDAFYKDFPKWDDSKEKSSTQPTPTPTPTPTITPRSDAEWNRIASENGFKDMAEVKAWQAANGLVDDGKFGNNSSAYFKANGLGKYQRTSSPETSLKSQPTPNISTIPSGDAEVSKQDDSTFLEKTVPVATQVITPEVATTGQTAGFNFDSFINDNKLESMFRNGKRYARYDPSGAGDFWVGEDGSIHEVTLGGGFGSVIHNTGINSNYAFDTKRGKNFRVLKSMLAGYNSVPSNKQGGTMNRINYFQQGGAATQQGNVQEQVIALVQAAMQGDQKATQTVNQIMEAAKAGDQQAVQLAQMIQQVAQKMQGQATAAKYGAKLSYLQSLKCGGKSMKKKEQGGKVCPECEKQAKQNKKSLISKHQQGGGFYRNWTADEIRKLQTNLYAYGYYDGELDGIIGPKTIEAVKKFQTEHGVAADGMWGHNTNTQKQFVEASTASKGSYKPTHKTEQGSLRTYDVAGKKMKEKEYYKAINDLKSRFYANPEAFWNDNGEMSKWREHLYTTPEGTAIMEEFYSATPDDVKKKLGSRVTNRRMQQDKMDSGIREATGKVADVAVKEVLPRMIGIAAAPAAVMQPVAALAGVGGAYTGRGIGRKVGKDLSVGEGGLEDTSTWTSVDSMGNVASVATPTSNLVVPVTEAIGTIAGGYAGWKFGQNVGKPSTEGLAEFRRTNNSAPQFTGRSQNRSGKFKTGGYGVGSAPIQGTKGRIGSYQRPLGAQQPRWADGPFGGQYARHNSAGMSDRFLRYMEGAKGNPSYSVELLGM